MTTRDRISFMLKRQAYTDQSRRQSSAERATRLSEMLIDEGWDRDRAVQFAADLLVRPVTDQKCVTLDRAWRRAVALTRRKKRKQQRASRKRNR